MHYKLHFSTLFIIILKISYHTVPLRYNKMPLETNILSVYIYLQIKISYCLWNHSQLLQWRKRGTKFVLTFRAHPWIQTHPGCYPCSFSNHSRPPFAPFLCELRQGFLARIKKKRNLFIKWSTKTYVCDLWQSVTKKVSKDFWLYLYLQPKQSLIIQEPWGLIPNINPIPIPNQDETSKTSLRSRNQLKSRVHHHLLMDTRWLQSWLDACPSKSQFKCVTDPRWTLEKFHGFSLAVLHSFKMVVRKL